MVNDPTLVRIVFLIIGFFTLLLGYLIKKNQIADIIAGFNPNKFDKKIFTQIYGNNLMLMGFLIILITLIYFILPTLNFYFYSIVVVLIVISLLIKMIYSTSKFAKK